MKIAGVIQRTTDLCLSINSLSRMHQLLQTRSLAFGKNWKLQPSKKTTRKRKQQQQQSAPKPLGENPSQAQSSENYTSAKNPLIQSSVRLPDKGQLPSFFHTTGSPYVFINKSAVQNYEGTLDPTTLFKHTSAEFSQNRSFEHVPIDKLAILRSQAISAGSDTVPEVAFLGRSNVGKSSLLNALMQTPLARTSKQPGRTQQTFHFGMSDSRSSGDDKTSKILAHLVDLPGYGYAVGPDQAVDAWQASTQDYLLQNRYPHGPLKRLYVLSDARHAVQRMDSVVWAWLDEVCLPYTVVLTKVDRLSSVPQLLQHLNWHCMRYSQKMAQEGDIGMSPIFHVTSSKTGQGLSELWKSVNVELGLLDDPVLSRLYKPKQ